jgi:phage shock protein PspC (stress-responsive transcriptional regulator)
MSETTGTTDQPNHPGSPPGAAQAGPPPGHRPPFRRSITDRHVAGVAGGLGRYFDIDPLIFRVVFVTLAVFGGSGLLLYAIGWLLVPEDGDTESEVSRLVNGRATPKIVGGIILAVVGLAVVGNFARTGFGFGGFAALAAVAVAAYLISRSDADRPFVAPRNSPGPPPAGFYGAPAAQGAYGQTTGTAYAAASPPAAANAPVTPAGPGSPVTPPPYQGFTPPARPWTPPPPRRPRSPLGRVTLSVALVAAGLLVALNLATTHDVPGEVVLALCLAVVGLGLVVGAFAGRARWLIAVGAVLVVATSAAGVSHVGWHGGLGDRTWAPRSAAALHDTYRLGVGNARLDLRQLQLDPGQTVAVNIRQGVGDLVILLPDQVPVDVVTDVQAGSIRLPDRAEQNGTSVHRRYINPRTGSAPVITIDAELGVGSLEVLRATS